MKRVSSYWIAVFVLLAMVPVRAQESVELIPPDIFEAAGLAKLTDAERKVLLDWLGQSRGVVSAPVSAVTEQGAGQSSPVSPATASSSSSATSGGMMDGVFGGSDEIQTRIVSDFSGWTGRTVFVLENGETWQQRMDGEYSYSGSDTRVAIRRGFMGLYRMELLATGRWIGVRRIK